VGCSGDCHWDFDADGDVDEEDLAYFASVYGASNSGEPDLLRALVLLMPAAGSDAKGVKA
jgi:hypothetical protein